MIRVRHRGNFNKIQKFFNRMTGEGYLNELSKYGEMGVAALAAATPEDTGLTASKWSFLIKQDQNKTTITWTNDNENQGVNVALILQYGHGTGTGGYVTGIDYINPAMKPVFKQIADQAWKAVTK